MNSHDVCIQFFVEIFIIAFIVAIVNLKIKLSNPATEIRKSHKSTFWRPENTIQLLFIDGPFKLVWSAGCYTYKFEVVNDSRLSGFFEHVEIDVRAKTSQTTFRIDDISSHYRSESLPLRLPCKCDNRILHFNDLNRYILLADMEYFQIRK